MTDGSVSLVGDTNQNFTRSRSYTISNVEEFNAAWVKFIHRQICCYYRVLVVSLLVSLYIKFMRLDLVLGPIVVGVISSLLMKGISMLPGNELAGGKVTIHPKLVDETVTSIDVSLSRRTLRIEQGRES